VDAPAKRSRTSPRARIAILARQSLPHLFPQMQFLADRGEEAVKVVPRLIIFFLTDVRHYSNSHNLQYAITFAFLKKW
jgi:hypothetical protein